MCGDAGLEGFHTLRYPNKNVYAGHIRRVEYQALGRPVEGNQPNKANTTINEHGAMSVSALFDNGASTWPKRVQDHD